MTDLKKMPVLAIDCQTTGAAPSKGRVLELGWSVASAEDMGAADTIAGIDDRQVDPPVAHLIQLPEGQTIPKHVRRVTGISECDMVHGLTEAEAWSALGRTAAQTAARNQMTACPTVIHYARFEKPFLEALHQAHTPEEPFPLEIICTHAIATRLLPGLPRRGIRALSGFFGFSPAGERRSADHVRATLFIWQRLVTLLSSRCGIDTYADLKQWLKTARPEKPGKRSYPMAPAYHRDLPDVPGVYRMRRINADILYVGKAKSLKKRVSSYFRPNAPHAEHILEMLAQARSIDVTVTNSALEAAMLEVEEIKRWSPPYNIALKANQNRMLFFNRDLTCYRSSVDDQCCLGPVPENQTGDPLVVFGKWLTANGPLDKDANLKMITEILQIAPEFLLDAQCLSMGMDLFRKDYLADLPTVSQCHRLSLLGTRFWFEHQQEKVAAGEKAVTENEDDTPMSAMDEPSDPMDRWTPEMVRNIIKGQVRRWAHLLRRARWFCTLSEAALLWPEDGSPTGHHHLLVTSGGKVIHQGRHPSDEALPAPPGHSRRLPVRQNNMDGIAYDRLRVLTTEIRRLVSENREMRICLGPNAVLTHRSLDRLLQWL